MLSFYFDRHHAFVYKIDVSHKHNMENPLEFNLILLSENCNYHPIVLNCDQHAYNLEIEIGEGDIQ